MTPIKRTEAEDRKACQHLIKEAEIKREQGDAAIASGLLMTAIFLALGIRDRKLAGEAMGHLLVCCKHGYEASGNPDFAYFGQSLSILGQEALELARPQRAVFHLREGDFAAAVDGDYRQAENSYRCALALVGKRDKARYAEYLSHLGFAQTSNGNDLGLIHLREAEKTMRADKKMRPFHRLTVLCGILIRIAQAAKALGKKDLVKPALLEAKKIAAELRDKHGMPLRARHVAEAARMLGVRL